MKQYTVILLLFIATASIVRAEGSPYADKEFMSIMNWLKTIDGYSYELSISSAMKANPKVKTEQHSGLYLSNADFIRYIYANNECSFMDKHGLFKVNHQSKEATYRQFSSEKMALQVMAAAIISDPGRLLDSVLLDKATVTSRKQSGDVVEYKLSYQKDYMIKSLDIRFDTRKNLLINVSYVVERYMNGIKRDAAILTQVVTMSKYEHGRPAALQAILNSSSDIAGYLHANYAGYNIHNL